MTNFSLILQEAKVFVNWAGKEGVVGTTKSHGCSACQGKGNITHHLGDITFAMRLISIESDSYLQMLSLPVNVTFPEQSKGTKVVPQRAMR